MRLSKRYITVAVIVIGYWLTGCSSYPPSYTMQLGSETENKLTPHSESEILAKPGNILQLKMASMYWSDMKEGSAAKTNKTPGQRELFVYAKVYKNGIFKEYRKITDLADHVYSYGHAVVQKPIFFTETVNDANYQIVIKAFEVDTAKLARFLRRVKNTDLDNAFEGSAYKPGDTLMVGLKQVLFGLFDTLAAVTGRTVDDWVAFAGADPLFEHSIYLVPDLDIEEGTKTSYLVMLADSREDGKDATKYRWLSCTDDENCSDQAATAQVVRGKVDQYVTAFNQCLGGDGTETPSTKKVVNCAEIPAVDSDNNKTNYYPAHIVVKVTSGPIKTDTD